MKKIAISVLLAMTIILSACKGNVKTSSDSSSSSSYDLESSSIDLSSQSSSISSSTSIIPNSIGEVSSNKASKSSSSATSNTTAKKRTIYIKDLGAKGDGKTNDGPIILQACMELMSSAPGSSLVFESNKTYYVKNTGTGIRAALMITGGTDLTIKGSNTTILADSYNQIYYASIQNTKNFILDGFNFNYNTKPFFVGTTQSIDAKTNSAVMTTDRILSPNMKTGDKYTGDNHYGLPDTPTGRAHMWVDKMEVLNASTRTIRVYFKQNSARFLDSLTKYKFIGPMPNVAYGTERAFTIDGNTNFTMKNCNTYSFLKFHSAVFNNEGVNRFINVDIVPDPKDDEVDFTGWCDGYHVKENRGKFIWDNCKVSGLTDDVFNISASGMYVKSAIGGNDIDMYWPEMDTAYSPLKPGDELSIYDTRTGKFIGRTTISRVVKQEGTTNRVKLKDNLGTIPTGEHVWVFIDSMVAPGSEIKNCDFDGTFRFRGPITITDTVFQNRRTWLDYASYEGPLPRNIIYRNCDIRSDGPGCIEVNTFNPNPTAKNAYKFENIIFENCKNLKQSDFVLSVGVDVTIR